MNQSKYYWLKLNVNSFDEDSALDYLMSLERGSDYVCLYLKLCTIAANKGGRLVNQIGEMTIPYDIKKLTRELKYFDQEFVEEALNLIKKLGLIYFDEEEAVVVSDFEKMVGSETKAAERMRKMRSERNNECNEERNNEYNEERNSECNEVCNNECNTDCNEVCNSGVTMLHIENRDKSIENRDIDNKELREKREDNTLIFSNEKICSTEIEQVVESWNQLSYLGIPSVSTIHSDSTRYKMLRARIKQYSVNTILDAVDNIKESPFLCGNNNKGWTIDFDWFIKPNNFIKVLDGNYRARDSERLVVGNIKDIHSDEYWRNL